MTMSPLKLGALPVKGAIMRSGVEWFCADGHVCRPNEVIGACNISVNGPVGQFEEEFLQIAFAPRLGGVLRKANHHQLGGFQDLLHSTKWTTGEAIAALECEDDRLAQLRCLYLASRRMNRLAADPTGLLPGWNSRARGWWGDETHAEIPTLLNLGICDASSVVRGERFAFLELFEAMDQPAHIVTLPDYSAVPYALFLLEQFNRSPAECTAIAADIMDAIYAGGSRVTPDDLLFAGALLRSLGTSPMRESHDLLTASGTRKSGPPDTILLSLHAEQSIVHRHRKLGYHLNIFNHCRAAAGPVLQAWITNAFEPVPHSLDDIRGDLQQLIATVGATTGARFMILNRMSTSGLEDISFYSSVDGRLGDVLANVASKELNLMLHDLADEGALSIIDIDAIAAEIGGGTHLGDGIHPSRLLQHHARTDILRTFTSLNPSRQTVTRP